MPHLLSLPRELLCPIAEALHPSDLVSFMSANRYLYIVLTPVLHTVAMQGSGTSCALHWAVIRGRLPLVKLLMVLGINPNTQCAKNSALHCAVVCHHPAIIPILVSHGADIEVLDRESETPLHLAAYRGDADSVRMLLQCGADVNARTPAQDTPLHYAGSMMMRAAHNTPDRLEAVRILLDHGADIWAQDRLNRRPRDYSYGEIERVLKAAESPDAGAMEEMVSTSW